MFCYFLLVGCVGDILNHVFSMTRTEGPEWVNPEDGKRGKKGTERKPRFCAVHECSSECNGVWCEVGILLKEGAS